MSEPQHKEAGSTLTSLSRTDCTNAYDIVGAGFFAQHLRTTANYLKMSLGVDAKDTCSFTAKTNDMIGKTGNFCVNQFLLSTKEKS